MLQLIVDRLGGSCNETGPFVIWTENSKSRLLPLLQLFKRYPPLTVRLQVQLAFLNRMLTLTQTEKSKPAIIAAYLAQRTAKYDDREGYLPRDPAELVRLPYYGEWLSGFIEAEGCFSVRADRRTASFSVCQKFDHDILNSIRLYLQTAANVNPRKSAPGVYYFETYNRASLLKIIGHCQTYPLLGEKGVQFAAFSAFILHAAPPQLNP